MRLAGCAVIALLTPICLPAQNPPVPAAYQDIYNTINTQITGFDAAVSAGWNGSKYPYLDSAELMAADSNQYTQLIGSSFYANTVTPQLEELQALGVKAVTTHIDFPTLYQPFYTYINNPSQYQQFVSFYQQLIQDVHARGMKLIIQTSLGQSLAGNSFGTFQPYLQSLSWNDYMTGRAVNALNVAQLIEPDYLSVMTEPDTEEAASGQTNLGNVSGVTQIVDQILATLQAANVTNVPIGAGAGTWTVNYTQYLQAYAAMPGLTFVDMHIFPINKTYFTNALSAADTIHAAGKQVGLSACWDWKIRDSEVGKISYSVVDARAPFSFWQPLDVAFVQAIANFANYKQLLYVSPYWTHYMFAYLDYNTYGTLPGDTVLNDSYTAATTANRTGVYTPVGTTWLNSANPPDTTPPATPPAPTAAIVGVTGFTLAMPVVSDNVGVSAVNIYRNGTYVASTSMATYQDQGLVSGETYTYTLTASDASGNVSAVSPPLVIETIDTTPPTVPTNLVASKATSTSVTLTWTPSTGVGGVGGYRVLKGTTATSLKITANTVGPTYTDPYAHPGTTYYYEVESFNPIGVTSAPGNEITVVTPTTPK